MSRKPHNREFSSSEKEWIYLMDKMPINLGIFQVIADADDNPLDFVYLYVNKAFAEFYNRTKEDYVNKYFSEIYQDPSKKFVYAAWKSAREGETFESEHYMPEYGMYVRRVHFPLAKDICGCIVEDSTVNHKLSDIVQKLSKENHKNYI